MVQEIKDLNICSSFKIIGDETSVFFHLFGYFVDNNLVGLLEFNHMYERIEIVNIFVIDQYRNEGIGTSLIEKLISYGKDNKCYNITLDTKTVMLFLYIISLDLLMLLKEMVIMMVLMVF